MRRARGFTLLELVVASAAILALTGAALGIMLTVHFTQVESQIRNATSRDCQLVLDTIGEDLRYLGAGVPFGANVQTAIGSVTNAANQLRPALRVAEAQYIAFLGDLPYPNAEFNGLGSVTDMGGSGATTTSAQIAVSSELSGCVPPSSLTRVDVCSTSNMSPAWGAAAPSSCHGGGGLASPTCPWALNKWQPNSSSAVDLVVTAPTGVWGLVRWNLAATAAVRDQEMISVTTDYPATGAHLLRRAPFVDGRAGASTVAQLDRVFYSVEAAGTANACGATQSCVLRRRQCWGPMGQPSAASFPAAGTAAATVGRSSGNPGNCAAPANGTRWEPITGGIEEMSFRYFDEDGTEVGTPIGSATTLSTIASIEVSVAIRRNVKVAFSPGRSKRLTQRMTRRYYLENYGPWVNSHDCDANGTGAAGSNCTFQGRP